MLTGMIYSYSLGFLIMEQLEFLRYLDSKWENELLLVVKLPCGVPDGLVNSGCCVMVTHNVNIGCQILFELSNVI